MRQPITTYKDKIAQTHREARATAVALAVVIVAWIALGFGLAGTDIQVFHTPLWVVGGTVGVLVVTLVVIAVLRYGVFRDFDLDDDEDAPAAEVASGAASGAVAGAASAAAADAVSSGAVSTAVVGNAARSAAVLSEGGEQHV